MLLAGTADHDVSRDLTTPCDQSGVLRGQLVERTCKPLRVLNGLWMDAEQHERHVMSRLREYEPARSLRKVQRSI
jgi:hypothetical protein